MPVEFIEGKANSLVWIVGLNPAGEQDWVDHRKAKDLENHFDNTDDIHPYFKDFKSVSSLLFDNSGRIRIAHTDIVKCSSRSFPPEKAKGKKAHNVISNCKNFLEDQIKYHKPKIIICNGVAVSKFMLSFLRPLNDCSEPQTSYWSIIKDDNNNNEVCIVLSGFIGRIDNFAKRRLGVEIEKRLSEIQLPILPDGRKS